MPPLDRDPRGLRGVRDRQGAGIQGELQALRVPLHLQTQAAVLWPEQTRVPANTDNTDNPQLVMLKLSLFCSEEAAAIKNAWTETDN